MGNREPVAVVIGWLSGDADDGERLAVVDRRATPRTKNQLAALTYEP